MCALRHESTAFGLRASVSFSLFRASRLAPDSEMCTACVSTFCVVSGTLHVVLLSLVLDVDEACYYRSTSQTVSRRQPCYWWSSAYRQQLRRLFLALSHDVQPSESAGHVFLFVNTVRSSRLAAINGPCWRTWNCLLPNCAHTTSLDVLRLNIN